MWKSPNGTIRAMLDGTVFRTPITLPIIKPAVKYWQAPITIARHAYGDVYKATEMRVGKGKAELVFTDENGVEVSYKYKLTGSGTAYTAPAGASTATGTPVYEGGVAINPNLIPYGSKLYVESTDGSHVYGYAKAIDTGGALMDGSAIVDVFYFSLDSCYSWGRRDVNVYVIE